jgi:hypothetical protein
MAGKPSFLKDPDQAAELAALLRDTADSRQADFDEASKQAGGLTRAGAIARLQLIDRYRRWADELDPEPETEAPAPVQIRPATRHTEEATG